MFSFICFSSSAHFKKSTDNSFPEELAFPIFNSLQRYLPAYTWSWGKHRIFTYNLQPISEVAPVPIAYKSLRRRCSVSCIISLGDWSLTPQIANYLTSFHSLLWDQWWCPFQVCLLTSFEAFKGSLSSLSKVFNRKQKIIKEFS